MSASVAIPLCRDRFPNGSDAQEKLVRRAIECGMVVDRDKDDAGFPVLLWTEPVEAGEVWDDPFVCAIQDKDEAKVQEFVRTGRNPSRVGWLSTLLLCVHDRNYHMFDLLLQLGADPNCCNSMGKTVLHSICKRKTMASVQLLDRLLREPGVDVNACKICCEWGTANVLVTPLQEAIVHENVYAANAVLAKGANASWLAEGWFTFEPTTPEMRDLLLKLRRTVLPAEGRPAEGPPAEGRFAGALRALDKKLGLPRASQEDWVRVAAHRLGTFDPFSDAVEEHNTGVRELNHALLSDGHYDRLESSVVPGDKCRDRGMWLYTAREAVEWGEDHWFMWLVLAAGMEEDVAHEWATDVALALRPLANGGAVDVDIGSDDDKAMACIETAFGSRLGDDDDGDDDDDGSSIRTLRSALKDGFDITTWVRCLFVCFLNNMLNEVHECL